MVKRTSKEYNLKNEIINIKTKYGTLNRNNPEVLYLRSKTKIKALIDGKDYKEELVYISKHFQKYVKKIIDDSKIFNKYICTFETPDKGIVFNKISNLKFDIYLHPILIKDMSLYEPHVIKLIDKANNKLIGLCKKYKIELL